MQQRGAMKTKFIHEEHNNHTVERRGGGKWELFLNGDALLLVLGAFMAQRGPDTDEYTPSEQCD